HYRYFGYFILHTGNILKEFNSFLRGVLSEDITVSAAQDVAGLAFTAFNCGERHPSYIVAETFLVCRVGCFVAGSPLAHQFHRGLAVADQSGFVVKSCAEETCLERIKFYKFLEFLSSLYERSVREMPISAV